MGLKFQKAKPLELIKKYKYLLLMLVVGILIMNIPFTSSKDTSEEILTQVDIPENVSFSEELARILSAVDGAGKVQVLLSESSSGEAVYQENKKDTSSDTVIISDAKRNEAGLLRYENAPLYRGAIVVCEGGDNPSVQFRIVEAVANATGLGADKISVMKMK